MRGVYTAIVIRENKMKKVLIPAFAVMALATTANAQPISSPAYIQQINPSSASVQLTTSQLMTPIINLVSQMPELTPRGPGNLGLVWQDGTNNNATIDQRGSQNVGLIRQIGMDNVASISQRGIGHQAMVFQQGRNNVAIIRQR
jgi:minor curlin subunit